MSNQIKIAVNARFLISNKLEGIGTYTHQLFKRLVKEFPEVEFHFLFDREWSEEFIYAKNVIPHKLLPQARHPFLWYWWFEKSVYKWLDTNKMDLFISPDSFLSLKSKVTTFLVMHDLAFEHYPKHLPYFVRKYYQYFFPKYARKADKIFAVSKFTKEDIVNRYEIKEEKIEVAYCGVSEAYNPLSLDEKKLFLENNTNGKPYYICIGSLNPRKNIQKVVEAFTDIKNENKELLSEHKLLIVGAKGWKTNELFDKIKESNATEEIILTGHLKPKDLAKFLGSASALVFPSLFEGFGIPIIEAQNCETPVITSNVSSTKEIGEGTAILLDPSSKHAIKGAMLKIVSNEQFRKELIHKANAKTGLYDWKKTVQVFKKNILEEIPHLNK